MSQILRLTLWDVVLVAYYCDLRCTVRKNPSQSFASHEVRSDRRFTGSGCVDAGLAFAVWSQPNVAKGVFTVENARTVDYGGAACPAVPRSHRRASGKIGRCSSLAEQQIVVGAAPASDLPRSGA